MIGGSLRSSSAPGSAGECDRCAVNCVFFFFSSRRRHTRCSRDWSSDVCSSDLASVQDSNFSGPLTVHDLLNQSSVYRGGFSPRSVKMYWLSQEVQCFRVDPINKQNHNAGRSKINS